MYLSIFLISKDPKKSYQAINFNFITSYSYKKKICVIRYVSYSYKKKDMNNKE